MPQTSHNANIIASGNLRIVAKDFCLPLRQNSQMAKVIKTFDPDEGNVDDNRNYLRAWIKFRKTTQAKLAAELGTSESVVSDLANGNRQLSPKWLRRIAPILQTTPGFLLDHDPNNLPTDILDVWSNIDPALKDRALQALKAFKKTGTEN